MLPTERATAANHLLAGLPDDERRRVRAGCATVELAFAQMLYTPGERLDHVYFPTSSFIALIMPVDRSGSLEVGLVGNEGLFGIPLALGVDVSPVGAMALGAGTALRMDAARFCGELERSETLRREIDRYVFVQLSQLAQAAACTRFHVVEARLARWLLMAQDRAHSDNFQITQEFLASMLGVRRVGVTKAASSLQDRGLIRYSRGNITVVDRRGLKAASCACYNADRESYDRVLGTPFPALKPRRRVSPSPHEAGWSTGRQ